MNQAHLSSDDPRLTAYALGELTDDERAIVEAAVQADPDLQVTVAEIRALAADLEEALAAEPVALPVSPRDETSPAPAVDHASPDEGLRRVTRFPYFLISGLAAACFAVVVAVHEWRAPDTPVSEKAVRQERQIYELQLAPSAPDAALAEAVLPEIALPAASMASVPAAAGQRESSAAFNADLNAQWTVPPLQESVAAKESAPFAETGASNDRFFRAPAATGSGSGRLAVNGGGAAVSRSLQVTPMVFTAAFHDAPRDLAAPSEDYARVPESRFMSVSDQPVSTFSADVDTAAYANVRRFLRNRQRPPVDAVRIEEMVNYFPYRYRPPADDAGEPIAAGIEAASAPWNPAHRLVRIGLKGKELTAADRPAANLVFLLDVSGSMHSPERLPLVLESMRLLVDRLRPDDRVAIVTYAGQSGLALPSTPASAKREIHAALSTLRAGGSTHGSLGIQLAYDIARANFVPDGLNRVLLCTDGDFNVGVTHHGELVRLVEEKARSGVSLTVFGFGMGNLKDDTLELLAKSGNGSYGYVDSSREARKLLVEQVEGTLATIAQDVKIQVEFNPAQVASYRLIGYENRRLERQDFADDTVDAGEIGAGHTVTALYEVVPAPATSERTPASEPLRYQLPPLPLPRVDPAVLRELLTVRIRFKEPQSETSRQVEFPFTDGGVGFADASGDFKFAAAVAGFGLILRDSPHKGQATFEQVLSWAEAGLSDDKEGHRAEFVELVKQARELSGG